MSCGGAFAVAINRYLYKLWFTTHYNLFLAVFWIQFSDVSMVISLLKSSKPILFVSREGIEQYLSGESVSQIIRYVLTISTWLLWASFGTKLFFGLINGGLNHWRMLFALLPIVWAIEFEIFFIIFCLGPCPLVERLWLPAQNYFRNFECILILNKCHDIGIRCFFWGKNCFTHYL